MAGVLLARRQGEPRDAGQGVDPALLWSDGDRPLLPAVRVPEYEREIGGRL
jgi:hypothetical protein